MRTRLLNEMCISITDCPHSTPKWTDEGKLVIRNQYIKNGRLDLSNPSFTDGENFEYRCRRAKPMPGDIIITREAPMGEVCIIPDGVECCLGQRMVLLKPDPQRCDNRFLLYALMSSSVQHQISWSEGTGTTVSNLRIPHLENLRIPEFPMDEQVGIGTTLAAIDEKISISTAINHHLPPSRSATDNSPDIRRGKRASRRAARLRHSSRLFSIADRIGTINSTKSAKIPSDGMAVG